MTRIDQENALASVRAHYDLMCAAAGAELPFRAGLDSDQSLITTLARDLQDARIKVRESEQQIKAQELALQKAREAATAPKPGAGDSASVLSTEQLLQLRGHIDKAIALLESDDLTKSHRQLRAARNLVAGRVS